jgi:hypothetical protein
MSKLGIIGAAALSLALAVATPAFAVGLRGGGAMHVGSGGFRDAQGSAVSRADASYCAQRWAYYDPASGKYMGDDGEWRPCPWAQSSRRRYVGHLFTGSGNPGAQTQHWRGPRPAPQVAAPGRPVPTKTRAVPSSRMERI